MSYCGHENDEIWVVVRAQKVGATQRIQHQG